ncbi:ANTH domain-containing protein [Cokeromyces recurvatus]|uniref:ANTH domain-containing protein n=1 Tax=Cokeromyces recurvatus TaxID=90255 RepID=UPI0022208A48|nr:ANTH domain-containing protein [Cokeromyces recurvatus]KAI7901583.1 ANTH domain-containing protein [Cokeromyces recurvatus]
MNSFNVKKIKVNIAVITSLFKLCQIIIFIMETAVRKATRLEYRPPKVKHLITLRDWTYDNPESIDRMLVCLEKRLKERSWIITYKVFAILHYLMREGNCTQVVDSVIRRPSVLDASQIKNKSSIPANIQNIYLYRAYLDERIIAFRNLKRDYIKETSSKKEGRLRHLRIEDGLLKDTTALQRQMESVLKCKFYLGEKDPSITLFAYRMVIEDLLSLFQAVNEGVVNILEHYFEMNKAHATTALTIYKTFAHQTELTIDYLNNAKRMEIDLEMNIPSIKHAPLSLASALEEYLNDVGKKTGLKQAEKAPTLVTQQQTTTTTTASTQQPQQSLVQTPFMPLSATQQTTNYQIQNTPFNNNNNNNHNQSIMDAAFSTLNRHSTLPIQQQSTRMTPSLITRSSTITNSTNPFLNMTALSQPTPHFTTSNSNHFHSPFATIGHAPQRPTSSSTLTTASLIGDSYFRSLSMNAVNTNNQIQLNNTNIDFSNNSTSNNNNNNQQQIPVAKPILPQATGMTSSSYNPFSPVTPPLTPNQPMNLFSSSSPMSTVSRNPFSQQNFNFNNNNNNTTNMNPQFQSSSAF